MYIPYDAAALRSTFRMRQFVACIQVNIDFESEQDMVEKARIGLALQPVATALFANSPFRDGKPTGG